jgi:hypothetical protein
MRRVVPILDPKRIVRSERRIEWRVSRKTHFRFRELLMELVDREHQNPHDPDLEALRDDIRHLPDFPRGYDPERDVIVPVVTTEQQR